MLGPELIMANSEVVVLPTHEVRIKLEDCMN